jgi:murein DD-endopeptidase MepM/ murein hydrolase activator NlpD
LIFVPLLLALLACAGKTAAVDVAFTGRLEQGGIAIGTAPKGATVTFNDKQIAVTPEGHFILGFDRDAPATTSVTIARDGKAETQTLAIAPRVWDIQNVTGLPEKLVTPDPETTAKIAADNKLMVAARGASGLIPFFEGGFMRPAEGPTSGVYGSQRILNGQPRAPHVGWDIAAPVGAPVRAAADGKVLLVNEDMVLTGKTVVIDHGYGLETVYIHMSALKVTEGQMVKRGDVIGAVGKTGRATGPHLHFGVTWFNTRLDPETVLAVLPVKPASTDSHSLK